MKRLTTAVAFFLLFWALLLPLEAETLFHDDFSDGDNWEDNWYHLGSPGGEILQVDGHLEIMGGELVAQKQTSAITKQRFDFANGVTFQGVITPAGADQVQFWVANEDGEGQAEDDPWFTENWLRVDLENGIHTYRANPGGGGMAGEANVPMVVGTSYKISIYMDTSEYTVYVDGEEIESDKHGQDFSEAYLIFAVWTAGAAVDENYKLDDVFVYAGDYDPNPSAPVESEGKLTGTWGSIKTQY